MKILFIAHYFHPEPNFFIGLPFARELSRQGHDVQVLTGFPNYPEGKIYDRYKGKILYKEVVEGIPITRLPIYPSHNYSSIKRMLSYTSLSLTQAAIGPFVVKKADVAFVSQGPATIGLPSITHKCFRKIPFVFNIQDLWPDTLLSTGMFNSSKGLKLVDWWCRYVYKKAAKIVVIAPGMKKALIERGVPEDKVDVIYNWCDDTIVNCRAGSNSLKRELRLEGKFNIMFAGNMGKAQALDSVMKAASMLKERYRQVQFVMIGSGVEVDHLRGLAKELKLTNVIFHGQKPFTEIGSILKLADGLLVHLRDDPLFSITIPSKTQAYLAIGRPIIIGVKGDASNIIEQANAGFVCEPENPESIAQAIVNLLQMPAGQREIMGSNARDYYEKHMSFQTATKKYIEVFERAII